MKDRKEKLEAVADELLAYLGLLIRKWILLLLAIVSFSTFVAGLIKPDLRLPTVAYWSLLIIGLIWANFQVYRELAAQIPQPPHAKASLSIGPVPGNAYSSHLGEARNSFTGSERVPAAQLVFHLRITNDGSMPLTIVSLRADSDWAFLARHGFPWQTDRASQPEIDGARMKLPAEIEVSGLILCDVPIPIYRYVVLNEAQFAARLAKHNFCKLPEIECSFWAEAVDPGGGIHTFELQQKPDTSALKDLYVQLWQERHDTELLRLAQADGSTLTLRTSDESAAIDEEGSAPETGKGGA